MTARLDFKDYCRFCQKALPEGSPSYKIYCTEACCNKHESELGKEARRQACRNMTCIRCGTIYDGKRKSQKFCSWACYRTSNREKYEVRRREVARLAQEAARPERERKRAEGRKRKERTCPVCQTVFYRKSLRNVCCSISCGQILRAQREVPSRKEERLRKAERTCPICATKFYAMNNRGTLRNNRTGCCSQRCSAFFQHRRRREAAQKMAA